MSPFRGRQQCHSPVVRRHVVPNSEPGLCAGFVLLSLILASLTLRFRGVMVWHEFEISLPNENCGSMVAPDMS